MRWRKFHLIEFAIDRFHTWKKDNCECISVHVKFLIEHLKYYAYKWKKKHKHYSIHVKLWFPNVKMWDSHVTK